VIQSPDWNEVKRYTQQDTQTPHELLQSIMLQSKTERNSSLSNTTMIKEINESSACRSTSTSTEINQHDRNKSSKATTSRNQGISKDLLASVKRSSDRSNYMRILYIYALVLLHDMKLYSAGIESASLYISSASRRSSASPSHSHQHNLYISI